jgi:hypothetical protein
MYSLQVQYTSYACKEYLQTNTDSYVSQKFGVLTFCLSNLLIGEKKFFEDFLECRRIEYIVV